ncbi:MAG TPA: hypothetical protein VG347_13885 [Verrucomicrobiae bacterium]|nr:hypothetical protein [Verrucomicrobiae bacterium]
MSNITCESACEPFAANRTLTFCCRHNLMTISEKSAQSCQKMKASKKLNFTIKLILLSLIVISPQIAFSINPAHKSVQIAAIQDAVEPGPYGCIGDIGTVGQFQITRTDSVGPLKVYIARSGTATGPMLAPQRPCDVFAAKSGVDYTVDDSLPIPCSSNSESEYILLTDGQASATVNIYPYFDYECEPTETVIMSISVTNLDYVVPSDKGTATNNIYDTPEFGFFIFTDLYSNNVTEGEPATVICKKDCACSPGGPLYGYPVTNTFVLLGNAVLTNDYVFDENPNLTVLYWKNPVEINMIMGGSNDYTPLTITTFSNCSFGDKILQFVPLCSYTESCPRTLPYQTNIVDCPGYTNSYYVGYNDPYLTIRHPTNQPTLDSAMYNAPIFQFNINGQSGAAYTISTSTNLFDWASVASFTMTSCTMQASDLLATNFTQRFYRIAIGGGIVDANQEFSFQEATPNFSANLARQSENTSLSRRANLSAASADDEVQLTPNEQFILIEALRLKLQEAGDPEADLLPPTPLSSPPIPYKIKVKK